MGADSKIEWCDHSFNAWWGCTHDGPECDHCYAESFAKRTGHAVWGHDAPRRFFGDAHWAEPLAWEKEAAKSSKECFVFCSSMSDIGERLPGAVGARMDADRLRLVELIAATPHLTWLVLTKRPQNMPTLFDVWGYEWPKNVMAGTTAGTQAGVDKRVKWLLRIPARRYFLSCEPLLERIDVRRYLECGGICDCAPGPKNERCEGKGQAGWIRCNHGLRRISWVICGGESNGGARPFDIAWARDLAHQCASTRGWGGKPAPTAFFMKQFGVKPSDGLVQIKLKDRFKGKDPLEWPADLRVRQFPSSGAR